MVPSAGLRPAPENVTDVPVTTLTHHNLVVRQNTQGLFSVHVVTFHHYRNAILQLRNYPHLEHVRYAPGGEVAGEAAVKLRGHAARLGHAGRAAGRWRSARTRVPVLTAGCYLRTMGLLR